MTATGFPVMNGEYQVDIDRSRLQVDVIHGFLSTSYWAKDIPLDILESAIARSDCFGLYRKEEQAGFARVITDGVTFGYVSDVFVLPAHSGHGLGKWLMEVILSCERYKLLRRWMLATRDAHGLYQRFGFKPADSGNVMELLNPYPYAQLRRDIAP